MKTACIFCDLAKTFECIMKFCYLTTFLWSSNIIWKLVQFLFNWVEAKSPNTNKYFFLSDWGTFKHAVPQGSIVGSLLFIIYVSEHPLWRNSISEQILFADDVNVIISARNLEDFCSMSNLVLLHMIIPFAANKLLLNLDKTNIMKFVTNNLSHSTLHIGYRNSI